MATLFEESSKYDDVLLSILQSEGKIEPFLDTVFKFLYKRTDFYLVQDSPNVPYGFPSQVAKQIVLKTFNKYDSLPKDVLKQRLLATNEEVASKLNEKQKVVNQSTEIKKPDLKVNENSVTKPDVPSSQEAFQSNPASYNGAIRENYSWTQSIKDIDVRVKIDSAIKTSKEVKVKIEKDSIQVLVKDQASNSMKTMIEDKLAWKVRPDECTWSLFPGDHIHIYLEKIEERWWDQLLLNEEKIDLKKIQPEKPLEDLDQESQAKIKQMMYDERQKRLGLPTSEEQKNIDMLAKAWNAEGSPFKGTPFDPSILMKNDPNDVNRD